METLPVYISLVFGATTALTLYFFYRGTGNFRPVLLFSIVWITIQSILGIAGFYKITDTIPPRFALAIAPPVLLIAITIITKKGRAFLDRCNERALTLLHMIRIPVELVLFALFTAHTVPEIMTFEGRNLDILSGITAPIVYFVAFRNGKSRKGLLIAWNILCLALLINIVVIAILSAPFVFQRFGFEQPNVAILYFPFNLLPAFVVPVVLFSHVASLYKLLKKH